MVQAPFPVNPPDRSAVPVRRQSPGSWRCLGLLGIFLLAGCATTGPGGAGQGARKAVSDTPAVVALADRASQAMSAGHPEAAAASLERALRLEPRNPRLWYRLARVRLAQHRNPDAGSLASKAVSLSGEPALTAAAWRVVAAARRARGDIPGARDADRQAAQAESQ